MPINNTPITGLNVELNKCNSLVWHDFSGMSYKDSVLLQLLYDQDQADQLTAQMYISPNGKVYSSAEALIALITLFEEGAFDDCNVLPEPFARVSISFELEEIGTCPSTTAIRYGYTVTVKESTIIADTRTTPDTIDNVNSNLPNIIGAGLDGDFCGNPLARSFSTTVTALTTANRFRVNGGADLFFPGGNVTGQAIFMQIFSYQNATPIAGIISINNTIFTFHSRISTDTSITSIEYFNTTTNAWVAFEISDSDYDNKCSGCYTITPYSTNCDGVGNATIIGEPKSLELVPVTETGVGVIIGDYRNVFQIFSPYSNVLLGLAQSTNTAKSLLSNDTGKPIGTVVYDVAAIDDDSANSFALYSAGACDQLPNAITAGRVQGLILVYDNILNTPVLASDLAAWNTFFNTAINAITPFSSVTIVDNRSIVLAGCKGLNIRNSLFDGDTHILCISDTSADCVVSVGDTAFEGATSLHTVSLPYAAGIGVMAMSSCLQLETLYAPNAINIQSGAFANCPALTDVYINGCTGTLGGTALDDNVFLNCGVVDRIWVSIVQQTINAGGADGDLSYIAGLVPTVTINYV
jgi:hypothetical protein